jgi:hypothetical protein
VNLAARVQRLENCHGTVAGRCMVCRPVRSGRVVPSLVVAWSDGEAAVPRLCGRCGEPWPDIRLTFGPDGEMDV